jgi:Ankyrin repeats (3 copies)
MSDREREAVARVTRRPPDRPPWIRWIDEGDRAALGSWLAGGGNVEDEDPQTNNTPLVYAAWHGQREIVNLLLAYGANGGSGAFLVAVATGHTDIARILLPLTDHQDHLEQAAGNLAEHTDDQELEELVNIKLARLKAKKGRKRSRP